MRTKSWKLLRTFQCSLFCLFLLLISAYPQEEIIDFESDRWMLIDSKVVEHLGQKSLRGSAVLKDVVFENGVIEVDIAFNGTRCFAGFVFRMQSQGNFEQFYIRPHRTKLTDALQYTPVFNGLSSWQLYSGGSFTAPAEIPYNQWIHIKMEVSGKQATVYLNNADKPSLVINDLKHGLSKGSIGVYGPNTGQVHFANFKYKIDNELKFDPAPKVKTPPGMITQWQLSQAFKISQINREHFPTRQKLPDIKWQEVSSEPSGLVNIARYVMKTGMEPDCVLARTTIHSDKEQVKKLLFGYSDEISIFLNEKPLFRGNSEYQRRDPGFLGIVGMHDAVFLDLQRGKNELLLMVTEVFGGWGFICKLDRLRGEAVFLHESVTKLWESPQQLITPESVLYDSSRNVLYVSNFNRIPSAGDQEGNEFISKLKPNGEIENLKWVTGLTAPTGLAMFKEKLYVVERGKLVTVDIESGQILNRYPVPGSKFLNDVSIDSSGNVYLSDSVGSIIYKFYNGKLEEWLKSDEIIRPNGICVDKDKLIVGNNGDESLKSVNLSDKKISTIVNLGPGIIDGIKADGQGNYIVSHWEGKVYLITQSGKKVELVNSIEARINCADLEYVPEKNLLFIPTFYGNRLMAYQIEKK